MRPSRSTRLTCTRTRAADDVAHAGALAAQLLAHLVEAVVLAAELGDVHQAFDVQAVERDEQAEARDRADRAAELLAEVLAHVAALEPGLDVARGLVGAALVGAAVRAGGLPLLELAAARAGRFGAALARPCATASAPCLLSAPVARAW